MRNKSNIGSSQQKMGLLDKLAIRYYKKRIEKYLRVERLSVESALSGIVGIKDALEDIEGGKLTEKERNRFYKSIRRVKREENIEKSYKSFLKELYTNEEKKTLTKKLINNLMLLPASFVTKYGHEIARKKYENNDQLFYVRTKEKYGKVLYEAEEEKYRRYMSFIHSKRNGNEWKQDEEDSEVILRKCKYILSKLENVGKYCNKSFLVKNKKGTIAYTPCEFIQESQKKIKLLEECYNYRAKYGKSLSENEQQLLVNLDKKMGMFTDIAWERWMPKVKEFSKQMRPGGERRVRLNGSKTFVDLTEVEQYSKNIINQLLNDDKLGTEKTTSKANKMFLVSNMLGMHMSAAHYSTNSKGNENLCGYLKVLDEYMKSENIKRTLGSYRNIQAPQEYYIQDIFDIASGDMKSMKYKIAQWNREAKQKYPGYYKNQDLISKAIESQNGKAQHDMEVDFIIKSYRGCNDEIYNSRICSSIEFSIEKCIYSFLDTLKKPKKIVDYIQNEFIYPLFKKEKKDSLEKLMIFENTRTYQKVSRTLYPDPSISLKLNDFAESNGYSKHRKKKEEWGYRACMLFNICLLGTCCYFVGNIINNLSKVNISQNSVKETKQKVSLTEPTKQEQSLYSIQPYKKYRGSQWREYIKNLSRDEKKLVQEFASLEKKIGYKENHTAYWYAQHRVFYVHFKKVLQITNKKRKEHFKEYIKSKDKKYLEKAIDYTNRILTLDKNLQEAQKKYGNGNVNEYLEQYYFLEDKDVQLFKKQLQKMKKYLDK